MVDTVSMSTNVKGIVEPNEKHMKYMAIVKACMDAKVSDLPMEVEKYFKGTDYEGCEPSYIYQECKDGMTTNLRGDVIKEINEDGTHGIQVDIRKLPSNVKLIRFENRY